ncbi:MAG TPA: hypothetical protein VFS12_13955, partial [Terriglobia bacterium]|nr:hypothetical protein [Terriglobia bacterium]
MLFLQGLKEGPEGHHGASHNELSDDYERISRFHLSQVAYLAGKLDGMPEGMVEGEGTVLDNCLQWLWNMWAGWKHDNMKVPVVLAGPLRLVVGVVITHEVGHLQIARGHSDAGSGAGFPACRFAGLS